LGPTMFERLVFAVASGGYPIYTQKKIKFSDVIIVILIMIIIKN